MQRFIALITDFADLRYQCLGLCTEDLLRLFLTLLFSNQVKEAVMMESAFSLYPPHVLQVAGELNT